MSSWRNIVKEKLELQANCDHPELHSTHNGQIFCKKCMKEIKE